MPSASRSAEITRQEEACETWRLELKGRRFYYTEIETRFLTGTPLYSLLGEIPRNGSYKCICDYFVRKVATLGAYLIILFFSQAFNVYLVVLNV